MEENISKALTVNSYLRSGMDALGTAGDIEWYHRRRRTKVREHWVCILVMLSLSPETSNRLP